MAVEVFTEEFLSAVESLVNRHHTIYPRLPPQGLFFEALVGQAFRMAGWSREEVVPTTPNSPWHDLSVGGVRLSIKSETGKATKVNKISITKLCTTETGEWNTDALVGHTIAHLNRHDRMLMVRAIWQESAFHYQLVEIPLQLLTRMKKARFSEVGTRRERRSLAADVTDHGEKIFRVHFDGADGKCQIHGLLINRCRTLREWQQPVE
jgi:type II restriction enzyme